MKLIKYILLGILIFLIGILIGQFIGSKIIKPAKATGLPITCATQCIASECGTTEGLKYEVQETYEYANGICPSWYHWQNDGNWNERCHRDFNWMQPEHKAPIGCPEDYVRFENTCRKTNYECNQVSCDCAEIIPCASHTECIDYACVKIDGEGESQCEIDDDCVVITPTPTPVTPPTVQDHSGPVGAPQCEDKTPLVLPSNVHVVRSGSDATVNFFTSSSNANIYYKDVDSPDWQYSARDIVVTGGYVSYTIHDLKIGVGYTFGVQAANTCAGGETVLAVVVDGPKSFTFPLSYWEWLK